MRKWTVSQTGAVVGMLAALSLVAACGSEETGAAGEPSSTNEESNSLAAMLPESIREAGVIQTGSSFSAKPVYFRDENNEPAGALVEILLGAHEKFGVETNWREMPWTSLLVGLDSKKIDVTGAQETRTEDSADEAIFIGIYRNSSSMLVKSGTEVEEPIDICGLTVGVPGGSSLNLAWVENVDGQCEVVGEPRIEMKEYDAYTDQLVALRSGQIDALVNATPQQVDTANTLDDVEIKLQGEIRSYVSGFAVSNDNMALAEAYQAAITEMIEDGSYQAALDEYGLDSIAVDEIVINPPFEEPVLPF